LSQIQIVSILLKNKQKQTKIDRKHLSSSVSNSECTDRERDFNHSSVFHIHTQTKTECIHTADHTRKSQERCARTNSKQIRKLWWTRTVQGNPGGAMSPK